MLVKTEAVVLHAFKYGESRIIVDMFTRHAGRLSVIAALPKSNKSRLKKQYFQPMTLLAVEYEQHQRVQLQKLKDARLMTAWTAIPFSAEKTSITLFVAEFLYHALRSEQQNEPLFEYVIDSMLWLDATEKGFANFHLTFLMRLSRFLGFFPNIEDGKEGEAQQLMFDLREGRFCMVVPMHHDFLQPDETRLIHLMMRMDYPTMHLYKFSRRERRRIIEVLLNYYRLHIPQFPELKSFSVLQELWDV